MKNNKTFFARGVVLASLVTISYFVVLSCSTTARMPNSVDMPASLARFTPINQISSALSDLQTTKIDKNNCSAILGKLDQLYVDWAPLQSELKMIKTNGYSILEENFEARMLIHSYLDRMSQDCLIQTKNLFRNMRAFEDSVGLITYADKQISSDDVKFAEEPIPLIETKHYRPYFIGPAFRKNSSPVEKDMSQAPFLDYKKGDLMITKGISLISGTISSVATPQSLFSHIVFVANYFETYEVKKTKEQGLSNVQTKSNSDFVNANGFGTLESYIGTGVNFFTMREALLNENARILILRAKDQKLATNAHDYITKRVIETSQYKVEEEQKFREGKITNLSEPLETLSLKRKIRYDYKQDFSDNTDLSCEEIAFDAYKTASKNKFVIPTKTSQVHMRDVKMAEDMGLHNGDMMFPSDMETDARFDIVLDWTDYRFIRDNWRKDAVMSEIFRWVNEENYIMNTSGPSALGGLAWKAREIKFLWPWLSRITSIPENWEPGVPVGGIKMVGNIKNAGGKILEEITRQDINFFKKNNRWMTRSELRYYINEIRKVDLKTYQRTGNSLFHEFFRPSQEPFSSPIRGD